MADSYARYGGNGAGFEPSAVLRTQGLCDLDRAGVDIGLTLPFLSRAHLLVATVLDARLCRAPHHEGLILRRRASAVSKDGHTRLRILATRFARVLQITSAPKKVEGAGNAGRSVHPQPRV